MITLGHDTPGPFAHELGGALGGSVPVAQPAFPALHTGHRGHLRVEVVPLTVT